MTPHRVLVVEDNAPFRRILCELLRKRDDLQIVGEAGDGMDVQGRPQQLASRSISGCP